MQDDASLRALLGVLTNAGQGDAVARAVALAGLPDLGVHAVALHALEGSTLVLVGSFGVPAARRHRITQIPSDAPGPEQQALRGGEATAYTRHELTELPLHRHLDTVTDGSSFFLPLRFEARLVGLLTLQCGIEHAFDAALQRRLDGIMAALALWLASVGRIGHPLIERPLLNERQRRVIDGIRRGLTNAAIASELGFAVGTIKADITAMSALFGASGRADLLQRVDAAYS